MTFFTSPEIVGLQLKTLDLIAKMIFSEEFNGSKSRSVLNYITQTDNNPEKSDCILFYDFNKFIIDNNLEEYGFKVITTHDEMVEFIRKIDRKENVFLTLFTPLESFF